MIQRLRAEPRRPAHSQLWSQRYAPRTADEVLGETNRENARLLKAWMEELDVKGPSRRPVKTRVDKPRRRRGDGEFDDVLASDDDEESAPRMTFGSRTGGGGPSSDDDGRWSPRRPSSATTSPSKGSTASSQFDPLTNVILLCGPSGTGKTAAVSAVASQLGCDILELSSNSQRSQYHVARELGEAAKYHVVDATQGATPACESIKPRASTSQPAKVKAKPKGALDSFFKPGGATKPAVVAAKPMTNGHAAPPTRTPLVIDADAAKAPSFRKTIFLLEDVDVLFRSDDQFWKGALPSQEMC